MKGLHRASIANAMIWAAAIMAAAVILRGTPQAGRVVVLLGGAAGASVVILDSALQKARREAEKPHDPDASQETPR